MRARARAQRSQIDVTKNVTTMNIHDHRQYARESDHQHCSSVEVVCKEKIMHTKKKDKLSEEKRQDKTNATCASRLNVQ